MYDQGLYHIVEYIQEANLEKKEWSETIKTAKNIYMEEVAIPNEETWGKGMSDREEKKNDS